MLGEIPELRANWRGKVPGNRWASALTGLTLVTAFLAGSVLTPGQTALVYGWTNFVGQPGGRGNVDGTGNAARFGNPSGVAVDKGGNVFVADTGNNAIRKVTPSGVVTTLARSPTAVIAANGTVTAEQLRFYASDLTLDMEGNVLVTDEVHGSIWKVTVAGIVTKVANLFDGPSGIAVDGAGNVFVACSSGTIWNLTSNGGTALAGTAFIRTPVEPPRPAGDYVDATGSAARFFIPSGVAVASGGNLFVADTYNHAIRKVTAAGVVTTLAGNPSIKDTSGFPVGGYADGTGKAARFHYPEGVVVDSADNVFVADTYNHAIRKVTPSGLVTTLAGNALIQDEFGYQKGGHADGTGSVARFLNPSGVAVDSTGNLFVADSGNDAIRKVTVTGEVTTLAGSAAAWGGTDSTGRAARFIHPSGLALDSAGNLYVADEYSNTIRKVTPAGVVTTLAGKTQTPGRDDGTGSAARFYNPKGVAVDNAGNVFVADSWSHTIRKVTPAGVVTTLAGSPLDSGEADGTGRSARFRIPTGLAIDHGGNLIVADTGNSAIRKVTPAGVVTTLAGGSLDSNGTLNSAPFARLEGVAVDRADNVFAADSEKHLIWKVTPTGEVTVLADRGSTDGTGLAALFNAPTAVATDQAGNVFVADTGNHTIRKVTPAGVVTTIGNIAGVMGGADGVGSSANFSYPSGIAVDQAGTLYVADSRNNRITKGTPSSDYLAWLAIATSSSLPSGMAGTAYNQDLAASGGAKPHAWSIVLEGLPAGLRLIPTTGEIIGIPTGAGSFSFRVRVTGADNEYAESDFWLTINPAPTPPKITSGSPLTSGTAGVAYSQALAAGGGLAPYVWSVASGNLPSGLTLSSAGDISGTPFMPETVTLTVQVTDKYNLSSTKVFSMTVNPGYRWASFVGKTGESGNLDGAGGAARFWLPSGVAVDSEGNVYVADTWNHTIRKVTAAGVVTTLAGSPGVLGSSDGLGKEAKFFYPSGVAVDGTGNVFVTESGNNTIRRITAAGLVTTLAGKAGTSGSIDAAGSAARFLQPGSVAIDPAGHLIVADTWNHTIRKVTLAGAVTTLAGRAQSEGSANGTGSAARFYYPSGVAVDSVGNVFVADNNYTIRKVTAGGVVTTIAGEAWAGTGLAGAAADGPGSAARFNNPCGVAVDGTGNVFVADTDNHTIRKVTPTGEVTTIGGVAGVAGRMDGVGSFANFAYPVSIAVDRAGNLYVADRENHRISKGSPLSGLSDPTIGLRYDGTYLLLSWPAAYRGWRLEAQTNALRVGLDLKWFPVPGSTSASQMSISVDSANPSVFFRLRSK